MNLRKNLGRVASTIVATALLASVATVPAFAAGEPQFTGSTQADGNYVVNMTKELHMDDNLYQPTETFEFEVNEYVHGADEVHEVIEGIPVSDGKDNGVTVANAAFTTGTTKQTTANVQITVNKAVFSEAGIYKYTLSEKNGTNTNIDYDDSTKYLYVYVKNNDAMTDVEIYGVVVKDYTTGDEGAVTVGDKDSKFENTYGKVNEENVLHNVTLTKTLSGDAANLEQEFPFTITITNTTSDNQVFKIWNDGDGNGVEDSDEVSTITANATGATYQLGNDETVKIFGLRDGDTYTIQEGNMSSENNGKTNDGYTVKINNEATNNGQHQDTLAGDDADEISVTYDNNRTSVSPTGIAMNVAPYALLVVVAVAGCFVFLRKRNED